MITIQNKDKDIIAITSTLLKALIQAEIPERKYSYIRQKLAKEPNYTIIYKGYIIRRWKGK